MYNTKANKCKKCGEGSDSIIAGLIHLEVEHGINASYDNYLDYLEMVA